MEAAAGTLRSPVWRFVGWGTVAGGAVGAAAGLLTLMKLAGTPNEIFGHALDLYFAIFMATLGVAGGGVLGAVLGAFAAGGALPGSITLIFVAAGVAAAAAGYRWMVDADQGLALLGIGPLVSLSAPFLAGVVASRLAGRRTGVTRDA